MATITQEMTVLIQSDVDIVAVRQKGRAIATQLGFSTGDSTLIATAISELARNIISYAKKGEMVLRTIENKEKRGIEVVAQDEGPGILNIRMAMQDGFSTSGSLGMGLPGVRRLMDEFEIESQVGQGTRVSIKKWQR